MKNKPKTPIQTTNAAKSSVTVLAISNVLLALLMLILAIGYGTQWGQKHLPVTILGIIGTGLLAVSAAYSCVGIGLLKQRRAQHGIEINLEDASKTKSWQETIEIIGPCPGSAEMTPAAKGWSKVIEAIEQLQRELQLRQTNEHLSKQRNGFDALQLNQLLDGITDGIVLADNSGAIILANRSCEGKVGKELDKFVGKSILELFSDTDLHKQLSELLDPSSMKSEVSFDLTINSSANPTEDCVADDEHTDQDQTVVTGEQEDKTVLRIYAREVCNTINGGDIMLTIRDITQQEISRASRDEFIAHVSHEFRSPLTNIRAYTETLLSDMLLDAVAQKEAFNVINEETGRLTRLVNEVLDLSQMESGSLTLDKNKVVLDRLVRQSVGDVNGMATSKQITIQTNYHPKLPDIVADREKLAVVINNVLTNAIKYTPQGGTVFVETDTDERFVIMKITDTGYGISQEDLPRIFEKFYRVDRSEIADITGTGLGLAATREIVTLHGGTINVSSELDKGTEMLIKIPLTEVAPVLGPANT